MTVLANGNYVVASADWDNGAAVNAGAATWGSGTTGVSGVVSAANSLVGSTADDRVGFNFNSATGVVAGVTALFERQLRGRQPELGQRRARQRGRGDLG